jgi:hypothetical protein
MTLPTLLFQSVLAVGFALFICYLLTLVGAFLLVIGKGWLIELSKPEESPVKKHRHVDFSKFAWKAFALVAATLTLLSIGSRL